MNRDAAEKFLDLVKEITEEIVMQQTADKYSNLDKLYFRCIIAMKMWLLKEE